MAVLCEKVLQEQGGVLSVIRLIDTLTQSASGPEPPKQMPPFMADLTMVVVLRADQARGRFGIKIRPEAPSGEQLPSFEQTIQLTGGPWGASIVAPMAFPIGQEGVFWFDVFLTGPSDQPERLLTRMPLEVFYQPQPTAAS
jgi:hypothetical protein